jgi:hypothetical protein
MSRFPNAARLSLACLLAPSCLHARAPSRVGGEFQVNTYTQGDQAAVDGAADLDGNFVLVWHSEDQDGSSYGVFAQRFTSAGMALGHEFQVNSATEQFQVRPTVAGLVDDEFVVAWVDFRLNPTASRIVAQRFSSVGIPLGGELQVSTYTGEIKEAPALAAANNGDFVVAWPSEAQDGDGQGLFAQRFSNDGTKLGVEFQVNTYTIHLQNHPSVAVDGDGDFVIVWNSAQDGSYDSVFAQRFTSSGDMAGAEFQVNTYTNGYQSLPSVAMSAGGDFLVVWTTHGYFAQQDGSHAGVFAQRYASSGHRDGGEFQINVNTVGHQFGATVAEDAAGAFVAAWQDSDGSNSGIFVRRFSSTGVAIGHELQVNTYTTGRQEIPGVTPAGDDGFLVTWYSTGQDGSGRGLFAQRFGGPIVLDLDGDGVVGPLTDGILLLRFLFGLSGQTLTNGAVAPGCTRCDAITIEPYVASLGAAVDIDGDMLTDPLTDGVLALRYCFGFRGATLTTGAVGEGCTRCEPAAIEPYLADLTNPS